MRVYHQVADDAADGPYKLVSSKLSANPARVGVDDPQHHPGTDPE